MKSDHPITPPPELVQQWAREIYDKTSCGYERDEYIATRAAQWGADQELEACCEYLVRCAQWEPEDVDELRAARRPKPQSLKEQALKRLAEAELTLIVDPDGTIRRALEALPE
jgi:hypothetical protein